MSLKEHVSLNWTLAYVLQIVKKTFFGHSKKSQKTQNERKLFWVSKQKLFKVGVLCDWTGWYIYFRMFYLKHKISLCSTKLISHKSHDDVLCVFCFKNYSTRFFKKAYFISMKEKNICNWKESFMSCLFNERSFGLILYIQY